MGVNRFYWVIEDVLAGCSRPGGDAGEAERVDADLGWLKGRGIGAVLSMTETSLAAEALARHGFASLHLPVDDLTAPSPEQLQQAVDFIDWHRSLCQRVAVHCRMGQGRAGTVLAAHLIRHGHSAAEAIEEIRARCPGAIGTPAQEHALEAFAAQRDWLV